MIFDQGGARVCGQRASMDGVGALDVWISYMEMGFQTRGGIPDMGIPILDGVPYMGMGFQTWSFRSRLRKTQISFGGKIVAISFDKHNTMGLGAGTVDTGWMGFILMG